MKIIKKALGYLINGLVVLMVLLALISLTSMIKGKNVEKYIHGIGKYKFMVVLSGSMRPVFNTYDLIVDIGYSGQELKEGVIITAWKEDMLITHRVVEIVEKDETTLYKTKGDANSTIDEDLVHPEEIAGVYLFRIPYMGYVLAKIKGPLVIGIVWSLFIYAAVMEIGKEILKNNKVKKNKLAE